jgi:hypothetical protein
VKPFWRLYTSAGGIYYFVNVRSSGLSREHYAIRRANFWGKK